MEERGGGGGGAEAGGGGGGGGVRRRGDKVLGARQGASGRESRKQDETPHPQNKPLSLSEEEPSWSSRTPWTSYRRMPKVHRGERAHET